MKRHSYSLRCRWSGDRGEGTRRYGGYDRDHRIETDGKPAIEGSSDPAFRGDKTRWNPEELLLAALSSCHMLWYLHLCAENGLVLRAYEDAASAVMEEDGAGGAFKEAVLRPRCRFEGDADLELATRLHHVAHERCFIARSVNFPVRTEPDLSVI